MPRITLSQYPKYSLPASLREQVALLEKEEKVSTALHAVPDDVSSDNQHFVCTLTQDDALLAFVEIALEESHAVLLNVIVKTAYRERRLGTLTLLHALKKTASLDIQRIHSACANQQLSFFEQLGFSSVREQSANSRHSLVLPNIDYFLQKLPEESFATGIIPKHLMRLGQDSQSYHFRDEPGFVDLHRAMLMQARKRIWILSDTIRNPILDSEDTAQAIYRLIKSNPNAEVKILLGNDKLGAGYHNPCIALAQRLSSYIQIRSLKDTGVRMNEMITLVDFSACIYRKHLSDHNGFGCFHNRLLAERMRSSFDNHWQFGKVSMELRRLAI